MRRLVAQAAEAADDTAATRLAAAMLGSWDEDVLGEASRQRWRAAFEQALVEGRYPIAAQAGKVLHVDAISRSAFAEGAALADTLAELAVDGGRATEATQHGLEAALLSARAGDARGGLARVDAERARIEDPALDAYACFVAGEILLLAGSAQRAVDVWAGVLQAHARSPAPQAACRASWMLARLAREAGQPERERNGLELALRTGLDGGGDVPLVEQIALALARHYAEDGARDPAGTVLAMVGDDPRWARLRAAFEGGAIALVSRA